MEDGNLSQHLASMRQSFFDEGILDEQFTELEQQQDRFGPNFVQEVVDEYFRATTGWLATVEQEMDTVPTDFYKMDRLLYRLQNSSDCIGAKKVLNEIHKTRELLQGRNLEGAKVAFQDLRNEHDILKTKLKPYSQQLRHFGPSDTASPPR